MAGRVVILFILIMASITFAVAPSVTDMVSMGYNLEYIAQYIITHASEFEPFQVEVAKIFLASGASGAVTGAAALSTWAKFASITAWGIVAGLGTYDIVKAIELIGLLVELNDIKKGIATVREVQRYDRLGIQMISGMGKYQEYSVIVRSRYKASGGDFKTYDYVYDYPKYFDGKNIYDVVDYGSYIIGTYYSDGNKEVWGLAGGPSQEMIDFLNNTGIYSKTVQIFLSGSFFAPAEGVWTLSTPGWGKIVAGAPLSGQNEPLFPGNQPVGVVTTPSGFSLFNALTPEQWGNVRNLSDISLVLKFEYMPYEFYRNVPSYDNAPIQETLIDTTKISYNPDTGIWNTVSPETIGAIQQELQSLYEQVQSILEQVQQVQNLPGLEEQFDALQETQLELAELVETISQTLQQVQEQTEANTEAVQMLEEQYQSAVELMNSVQSALEELNEVKTQIQAITEQLNGVLSENDVIVRDLNDVKTALEIIQQEYPELKQQVQNVVDTLQQVQTEMETLSTAQSQTQEQYQTIIQYIQNINYKIENLSQTIQNSSVNVDLSPVVNAVNAVGEKVQALSEQIRSLDEYLREGFFVKLGEKIQEILERLFVPTEEQLNGLLKIDLPEYRANFSPDVSFSSYSTSIPITLFGATVDLSGYIGEYAPILKQFMNVFVSGIAAVFVIRAFRVYLNID